MEPQSKPSQRKPLLRNIQKQASPQMNQALQREALRKLLLTFGVGAAGGAAYRGLKGIGDMVRDTQETVVPPMYQAQPVRVQGPPRQDKQAFDLGDTVQNIGRGAQQLGQKAFDAGSKLMPVSDTSNPLANDWGVPATIGVGGAGALGGYKLIDWLLGKEKAWSDQQDVDAAQGEYQQAIRDQYASAMAAKNAGDDLGINDLADQYADAVANGQEKQAFFPLLDNIPVLGEITRKNGLISKAPGMNADRWAATRGAIHGGELLALLAGGKAGYNWGRDSTDKAVLDKALKLRRQQQASRAPVSLMATTEEDTVNAA